MTQSPTQPNPAEAYERFIAQNFFVPWSADLIARAAPKSGERVLDLACGTGIVTRSVAPMVGPEGKVTGLDISPAMLEVARSLAPANVEWQEGSGTEMPFPDASFDLVLCQQGLQFFPDHAKGLKEIRRVLAPGGRAVVSAWRDLDAQPFMKAVDGVVSRHLEPGGFGPPFSLSDAALLERLARDAGFRDVDVVQHDLVIRVADPESFVPMMLQGAAAVLPAFTSHSPEERQALMKTMAADLMEAAKPFIENGELVVATTANVLTARV